MLVNLVVMVWRLASVGQAFLDTGRQGPTGRLGIVGVGLIALVVAAPHLVIWQYGTLASDMFKSIFGGQVLSATGPSAPPQAALTERINVLLLGVDNTDKRTASLTDTMIVASLDPVGHTVSMASVPRDLVNVPLGNGDVFGPKLNSLMSYAERHPDEFPKGGVRTLQDAVGALLDIDIQYYAQVDFAGFVAMVDAVGGVDVDVKKRMVRPRYDGFGLDGQGIFLRPGLHHLSGAEALAYARIRKGPGESDFTRAERQQQILLALREGVTSGGSILFELPALLQAVGDAVKTDIPVERLPEFAAIADEMSGEGVGGPRGHRAPARRREADALRAVAGPQPQEDPGRGGDALLAAGNGADSVADTTADEGAETDADPLTQAPGGSDQRDAGGDQRANRASSVSRSGSTATSARWGGAMKPSATTRSSHPSNPSQ